MALTYLPDEHKFVFSYSEVQADYERYRTMPDEEFGSLEKLPHILHFAVFVCFLKELPTGACLCDTGIVHQLLHLLIPATREDALKDLREIRAQFDRVLELA